MKKEMLIVFLIVVLFTLSFVDATNLTNNSQTEEIGEGLFYNIQSGILKWFQRARESVQSIFVANVKTYESEKEKNREYLIQRNDNLRKSLEGNDEPPFNYSICPETLPINSSTRFTFCSCGDGVCASYEDKCKCPRDCGSCPEGTICIRGACEEYIENVCGNKVCEEGEMESCPWDCNIEAHEEEEEILSEEEKELVAERVRRNRIDFFRSHGMSEEEIEWALENIYDKTQKETLPEEVE